MNKYDRPLPEGKRSIDVYDVLERFNVSCSATQHAIKKLLCSGIRGYKSTEQDLREALESIERAIELQQERMENYE